MCTRKGAVTGLSLKSGGNEFMYKSTPIRDGNSYYYSIAVHREKVYITN